MASHQNSVHQCFCYIFFLVSRCIRADLEESILANWIKDQIFLLFTDEQRSEKEIDHKLYAKVSSIGDSHSNA